MPGTKTTANESHPTRNGSNKRADRPATGPPPASKRIRVSRACDQCRAGREKCDGVQPICNACQVQKRSCTYNEQPKKRGIQPNYIRTLELTLTWIFQTFPQTETRLAELIPDSDGEVHRTIAFKDAARSEELHQTWRSGLVARQIDQMLSGAAIETPETPQSNEAIASTENTTGLLTAGMPGIIDMAEPHQMRVSTSAALQTDEIYPLYGSSDSSEPGSSLLRLPEDSWSLLEHHFAFTQSWMPITEKHDILKLMYKYPSDGLSPTVASGGDHAELWSLMALSAFQRGSHTGTGNAKEVLATARNLVSPRSISFELGHAKALLIQCLIEMNREAWLAAWLAVGSAVRILTYLGSDMEQPKLLQIGRARHTLLAAFLLESAIAFRIGAHTHLKRSIVHEIGLPIEDGLEEWSPWRDPSDDADHAVKAPIMAISTFNKLVKLAERVHDRNFAATSADHDRSPVAETILGLLQNASLTEGRQQPSTLVTDWSAISYTLRDHSNNHVPRSEMNGSPSNSRTWMGGASLVRNSTQPESTPFMSIPNVPADSAASSTPMGTHSKTDSPGQLSTGYAQSQNWDFDVETGDLFSAGIFEELATLEHADEAARPQFMQNLGFGPDLDLAEFFGTDYQLSDPMLAHLQT